MFQSHLVFFLQLSLLQVLSSEYTLPDKYFINCGSKSNATLDDTRTFVGDLNPPFSLSAGRSKCVTDSNPSSDTPLLYQTARVYKNPSSFELEVGQNGTYMVRLHFFSFSSPINLSDAVFDVSASGLSLLSNFSVRNNSTLLIEEFLLTIGDAKNFKLYFVPSQNSSLAFVNAIEVFPVPDNFIPDSAPEVTSVGSNGNYRKLLSLVLHTVRRINVGGPIITPKNDTLWRTWTQDDGYLKNQIDVKDMYFPIIDNDVWWPGNATNYSAPDFVYNTAKVLNLKASEQANWEFPVSENVMKHLVRIHFCDFLSKAINLLDFNLFIYKNFEKKVSPYEEIGYVQAPFYLDFVVDTNGSRFINVSIGSGPENASSELTAFLNGVEIFEIQNKSDLVLFESHPKKKKEGLLVGSGLAFVVVLSMLVTIFLVFKRRRARPDNRTSDELLYGRMDSHERLAERSVVLPIGPNLNLSLKIPLADIQRATGNFDERSLIGEGGFGKVYKGTLKGIKIAVKRGQPGHGQGLEEFQTEVLVLSQIRHRHLVSLIGYCDEEKEMILVYEFMEKGTLRDHLYGSKDDYQTSSTASQLSWEKRLEICIGAAKGLHYLHTGSAEGIIHRDVKSTNILLDDNFVAKVADIGLSKSKSGPSDPNNESMVLKGSFGYLDPEYIRSSQYTIKSDVYSFGVVLFEVICAKPVIFTLPEEEEKVNLAKWGLLWQRKGQLENIIDPLLEGKINLNSLRVVGKIAEKCLNEDGFERPKMDEVEWHLEYALRLQQSGTQRGPYEDSTTTNAYLESAFPVFQGIPCNSFPVGEDDVPIVYSNTFSTSNFS